MFKKLREDIQKSSPLTYIVILLGFWQFGQILDSLIKALLKGYGVIE